MKAYNCKINEITKSTRKINCAIYLMLSLHYPGRSAPGPLIMIGDAVMVGNQDLLDKDFRIPRILESVARLT